MSDEQPDNKARNLFLELSIAQRVALIEAPNFDEFVQAKYESDSPEWMGTAKLKLLRGSLNDDRNLVMVAWHILREQNSSRTREQFALTLFSAIPPEYFDKDERAISVASRTYSWNAQRLFRWFLLRYDIPKARRVLCGPSGGERLARYRLLDLTNILLAGLILVCAVRLFVYGADGGPLASMIAFGYLVAILGPAAMMHKKHDGFRCLAAAKCLIPRLAAVTLIGTLFLFTEIGITESILSNKPVFAVGAMTILVGIYLSLEISERVHPRGRTRDVVIQTLNLLATGMAHSMTLIIFSAPFIESVHRDSLPAGMQLDHALLLSCTLLSIGILFNAIWAQEPISAPL